MSAPEKIHQFGDTKFIITADKVELYRPDGEALEVPIEDLFDFVRSVEEQYNLKKN